MNCTHGEAMPDRVREELPTYQGGNARHLCATCAYAQGKEEGRREATVEASSLLQLGAEREKELRERIVSHAIDLESASEALRALLEAVDTSRAQLMTYAALPALPAPMGETTHVLASQG